MPIIGADAAAGCAAPRLVTARLLLRPLTLADAPAMHALLQDPDVSRYTARIPHPYEPGMAEAFIGGLGPLADKTFGIERRADGAFLGCIGFEPEADPRVADCGFWLGRPYWGQGYASEALQALLDHGFSAHGLARIKTAADRANPASIRVQEKLSFAYIGSGEEAAPARGRPLAVERREVTRAAWEAGRAARALPMLLVAAVALVDVDGRVLLQQRPPGKAMAGLWEFPGGKLQLGESPEAALLRELKEELGIDTSESCLAPIGFASHRYEEFHLLMPLFVCRVWRGQPVAHEGQRLAWVKPARLGDYPMPPADLPLVPLLQDLL
jgi:8-oxo-dGTP diphosphatase